MTKGTSEGRFRDALKRCDLAAWAYKPPDDARNWKPSDYLVMLTAGLVRLVEVKDLPDAVEVFPWRDIRPSQLEGMRRAREMKVPYYLVVWWRRHKQWTVSDSARVLDWKEANPDAALTRTLLMSRFGVDATDPTLPGVLKAALLGDL